MNNAVAGASTPFVELSRADWAELAPSTATNLSDTVLERVRGLGDRLDEHEILDVYQPLSRLLSLYAEKTDTLHETTSTFLHTTAARTPFVIGVAGSVAVGKSTVSRVLRELLSGWPNTPHVELITTDGFLYPNAELINRGLLERKGFPESYDRKALLRFVTEVKSGNPEVHAPVYSHLSYDIVPGESIVVRQPDVLIVEGLNVLQPSSGGLAISDLFDFSIYVDARTKDIAQWYEERFLKLQRGAFANPESYFHRYAGLDEHEARSTARDIWSRINETNLEENIRPTRSRATLIMRKASDHSVDSVLLRKI